MPGFASTVFAMDRSTSAGPGRTDSMLQRAEFGILYVGMDAHCAIIETVEFAPAMGIIAVSSVAYLALASIETNRPLR
ncbi:MAG: hypothetical protein M3439_00515, partial [Chloroflexota bacterium]|nr:hypothetical protein [Chloroflexota bacterium]